MAPPKKYQSDNDRKAAAAERMREARARQKAEGMRETQEISTEEAIEEDSEHRTGLQLLNQGGFVDKLKMGPPKKYQTECDRRAAAAERMRKSRAKQSDEQRARHAERMREVRSNRTSQQRELESERRRKSRLKDGEALGDKKMGHPTILTKKEEEEIVEWIMTSIRQGIQVTRASLTATVEKLIEREKRDTPFCQNKPGPRWFRSFLKRHPELKTIRVGAVRSLFVINDGSNNEEKQDVSESLSQSSSSSGIEPFATKYGTEDLPLNESIIPPPSLQGFGDLDDFVGDGVMELPMILTEEEEEEIVNWITLSVRQGITVTRGLITSAVEKVIEREEPNRSFVRNAPGAHWLTAFLKRHPNLEELHVGAVSSIIVRENERREKDTEEEENVSESISQTTSSCDFQQPARGLRPEQFYFIESIIPHQRLQAFKNTGRHWRGVETAKELFHLWKNMKSFVEGRLSTTINGEVSACNPTSDEMIVGKEADLESNDGFIGLSNIKVEADDYVDTEGGENVPFVEALTIIKEGVEYLDKD